MKRLTLIVFILLITLFAKAQKDSIKTELPSFKSMVIGDKYLYAINKHRQFYVWDLVSLQRVFVSSDSIFIAIAKDTNNNIFLGTGWGKIFKLNQQDFSTTLFMTLKKELPINEIIFNSKNEVFLVVPYVIYDPVSNKYWNEFLKGNNGTIVKKRYLFFFHKTIDRWFVMPQYTFLDSKDRIWMIRQYGEFGGSIQVFDTQSRNEIDLAFDSLNYGLIFPRSVFEDAEQNIYFTSGLQHFFNSGSIYRSSSNRDIVQVFDGKKSIDTTTTVKLDSTGIIVVEAKNNSDFFIGPGQFNRKEQKIYFATTEGIYKANVDDEGQLENVELVVLPFLSWSSEPLAIGYGMSIKRIEFTNDNRLVFLTSYNGIGVYDGEKLIYLK